MSVRRRYAPGPQTGSVSGRKKERPCQRDCPDGPPSDRLAEAFAAAPPPPVLSRRRDCGKPDGVPVGLAPCVGVPLGVAACERDCDEEPVREGLCVRVRERDGERERVTERVAVALGVWDCRRGGAGGRGE